MLGSKQTSGKYTIGVSSFGFSLINDFRKNKLINSLSTFLLCEKGVARHEK